MIEQNPIIFIGIGICMILLLWVLFKEAMLNIIGRVVIGGVIIYFANQLFPQYTVGFNEISMVCAGVLGVPGIVMLYVLRGVL